MNLMRKLRNRQGTTLILAQLMVFVALFFTALIIDMGMGMTAKVQLQHINDAATLAGAANGKYGFWFKDTPQAVILPDPAEDAASRVIVKNRDLLPSNAYVTSVQMNPDGFGGLNRTEQYYSGSFVVQMKGAIKSFMLGNLPVAYGETVNIPWLYYSSHSRVQVTPTVR